jgi:hypothetical protein
VINSETYSEIQRLLAQVDKVAGKLLPGENETYRYLKRKYSGPAAIAFDDKTCLEVILRNVAVRGGRGASGSRGGERS